MLPHPRSAAGEAHRAQGPCRERVQAVHLLQDRLLVRRPLLPLQRGERGPLARPGVRKQLGHHVPHGALHQARQARRRTLPLRQAHALAPHAQPGCERHSLRLRRVLADLDALLLDELVPRMHVRGHLASGLRHDSAALGRCAALFLQRVCRNSRLAAFRPIDLVERGLDSSSGARVCHRFFLPRLDHSFRAAQDALVPLSVRVRVLHGLLSCCHGHRHRARFFVSGWDSSAGNPNFWHLETSNGISWHSGWHLAERPPPRSNPRRTLRCPFPHPFPPLARPPALPRARTPLSAVLSYNSTATAVTSVTAMRDLQRIWPHTAAV